MGRCDELVAAALQKPVTTIELGPFQGLRSLFNALNQIKLQLQCRFLCGCVAHHI
jgi:hypothetical protein